MIPILSSQQPCEVGEKDYYSDFINEKNEADRN